MMIVKSSPFNDILSSQHEPVVKRVAMNDPEFLFDLTNHHNHFLHTHRRCGKVQNIVLTRDRESPRTTTMSSIHLLDLVLDVEDLALDAVGFASNVERHE